MLTIRCTRKLLKYLHAQGPAEGIHPTTGLGDFAIRFQEQVRSVLECVGVPSYAVERETHEMTQVVLGVTVSRRVLGSLNDLALLSRFAIEGRSHVDLTSLAIEIADTPCSPIKYESPRSMTLALLRDRCKDV